MTVPGRKATVEEVAAGAFVAARLNGCTCEPEVRILELSPGAYYAQVAHEPKCGHPSQQKGQDA